MQSRLAVKRQRSGLAGPAALRSGLEIGQRAVQHAIEIVEDRQHLGRLVDLRFGATVVVGRHLVLRIQTFQHQRHVPPLRDQMEIGQRTDETRFGLVGVARLGGGIGHVVEVGKQRIDSRNAFEQLRIAVVDVLVLLGERIVVELIGNAAAGSAVGHDGHVCPHVGEIVVVLVVVALRERLINPVERGFDVGR